jgi:predicted NAD-dependent protein-ADP-ribosyltransferase YbiA (DUF1768 family)
MASSSVRRYSAFYGYETPLSNTRFCRLDIDGASYHSVEQYYTAQLARRYGLTDLVDAIMAAGNPMEVSRLCAGIQKPAGLDANKEEEDQWAMTTMEKALRVKVRRRRRL